MHLTDPLVPIVLMVNPGDQGLEFPVAAARVDGRSGPGGLEGALSDRHIRDGQCGADRLDSN